MQTQFAAIQMASTHDPQENLSSAILLIEQAAKKGAQCVALPEEFLTLGLTPALKRQWAEPFKNGAFQKALARCAKQNQIWLIGGTIPLKAEGSNKVTSSCLVWDSQGDCVFRYDKIHLFDVKVGDEEEYRESAQVEPGSDIAVFESPFGKIGLAICYDLRFPELFRSLMLKGAQILVLPSAFTIPTGKIHWEVLIKARAIENLCYVIAPGEVGLRQNGLGTYGHSMIVNPWGEILDSIDNEQGIIIANIDLEKLKKIRQQFPALSHMQSFVCELLAKEIKKKA